MREHNEAVNRLDFITGRVPITVAYEPGSVEIVEQHDGSKLVLKKVAADYDAHDRLGAMSFLQRHAAMGQVVTGLLYVDREPEDLHRNFNTVEAPLNASPRRSCAPARRRWRRSTPACVDGPRHGQRFRPCIPDWRAHRSRAPDKRARMRERRSGAQSRTTTLWALHIALRESPARSRVSFRFAALARDTRPQPCSGLSIDRHPP